MKATFSVQNDEMTKASADGKWAAKRQLSLVEIGVDATSWLPTLSIAQEDMGQVYKGMLPPVGELMGKMITLRVKKLFAGKQAGSFRVDGVILEIDGKPVVPVSK